MFRVLLVLPLVSALMRSSVNTFSKTVLQAQAFSKYEGLGNDFILINNLGATEPIFTPEQSVKLCDRNFGIGADGVIFAMPGKDGCDYTMRIYNSDGSEPQMCGNGIRCMARFLMEIEGKSGADEVVYSIATNAGRIVPRITAGDSITVDMGKPILVAEQVPTKLAATKDGAAVSAPISAAGANYEVTCVSMGNPHAVIFVDSLDAMDPAFPVVGPVMEKHPAFPARVNAEFVEVLSRSHVRMKVWERGAGPTLACGTGACAVVVAGVLTGRTERNTRVTLPGGDLLINWSEQDGKVYMTGPAKQVFRGSIPASFK